jgi:hypothetical protein
LYLLGCADCDGLRERWAQVGERGSDLLSELPAVAGVVVEDLVLVPSGRAPYGEDWEGEAGVEAL